MTAKDDQKEKSHQEILDSASRLLRQKGIAGARVADVMRGAGLTVGGFYAHFGSKRELIDETIRRTGAMMRERLFAKLEEKPPQDRAEVIVKRYLSAAHRDLQMEGCPMPAVVGEVGTTSPEHAEGVAEQIEALAAGLREHLPGKGRRSLSLALCALMLGGLSLSRALQGTELSDEMIKACRKVAIAAARGGLAR